MGSPKVYSLKKYASLRHALMAKSHVWVHARMRERATIHMMVKRGDIATLRRTSRHIVAIDFPTTALPPPLPLPHLPSASPSRSYHTHNKNSPEKPTIGFTLNFAIRFTLDVESTGRMPLLDNARSQQPSNSIGVLCVGLKSGACVLGDVECTIGFTKGRTPW